MGKCMAMAAAAAAVWAFHTAAQSSISTEGLTRGAGVVGADVAVYVPLEPAALGEPPEAPEDPTRGPDRQREPGVLTENSALFLEGPSGDEGECDPCGVVIETVTIGNPGNPPHATGFGGVGYVYEMGTYEVTAGQYAVFLNAVAESDPYGLYSPQMWSHAQGCKIERVGAPGDYAYSVAADWADRPVNFVSWGDAARFANWLHNGQPTGAADLITTEDGSYFLNGMTADWELEFVVREPDATWVIPSENEWYKAAYHVNDGVTGNYFNVPTGPINNVSNDLIDPDPGNNATFWDNGYTIGAPYYRTPVGAHENSASAYGTFDQGGNVMEWNEAVPEPDIRGLRGGSFFWGSVLLWYYERKLFYHSSDQFSDLGFRVARMP